MAYQKQTWRDYDDNKTEVVNMNQGAVVTPERLNHMETGIANSVDKAEVTAQLQQTEQSLNAQLAQTTPKVIENKRALNYYWLPEIQPSARTDEEGYFTDAFGLTADEYITNLWEPLRLANQNYMSRVNLGKDESGQYNVWRYHFTPKNYTKTVIFDSCLHGSEVTPMVTMARFFHYLLNEWEKYPELAYIHENVRIIYIPIANPWGTSQSPRSYYNSKGVNLNRNFDYKWDESPNVDPFTTYYKGTSPFSEVEARYVRDTLEEFKDNAVTYINFHNTGSPTNDFYVSIPEGYPHKTYDKLISYFARGIDNPRIKYHQTNFPNTANYGYHVKGVNSSIAEWCDRNFGNQYSSAEITKALEWFANVVIEHARELETNIEIGEKTITNQVTNAGLNSSDNWTLSNLGFSLYENGVVSNTGLSDSTTVIYTGDVNISAFAVNDYVYLSGEIQVPENCSGVFLRLRDSAKNITYVVDSISNPTPNTFIKLSGVFKVPEPTNLKYQMYAIFPSASDITNKNFKFTKPILIDVKKDIGSSSSPREAVESAIGAFFTGSKMVTLMNREQNENIKKMFYFLLNKINSQ